MMQKNKGLWLALLFPILMLLALIAYKKYILTFGQEVTLAISGYDPRDILSGHYLIYTVEYPVGKICTDKTVESGYVCLDPKGFSAELPAECKIPIRGTCKYGRFEAGIEKFYIPEDKAQILDNNIRGKRASIVISVTPKGQAQVKDLLIDGNSWRDVK